jgi:hypothetical protein
VTRQQSEGLNKVFENGQVIKSRPSMEQEQHIVDGLDIKSDGRTIAFIRVLVRNNDKFSNKAIQSGIKETIKILIDKGFDVIRRTSDDYDDSPGMYIIIENMASAKNEHIIVSIRSGTMDKFSIFSLNLVGYFP